jgi:hypothetical protein
VEQPFSATSLLPGQQDPPSSRPGDSGSRERQAFLKPKQARKGNVSQPSKLETGKGLAFVWLVDLLQCFACLCVITSSCSKEEAFYKLYASKNSNYKKRD